MTTGVSNNSTSVSCVDSELNNNSNYPPAMRGIIEKNNTNHRKFKRRKCYRCGLVGHLSFQCPDNTVESTSYDSDPDLASMLDEPSSDFDPNNNIIIDEISSGLDADNSSSEYQSLIDRSSDSSDDDYNSFDTPNDDSNNSEPPDSGPHFDHDLIPQHDPIEIPVPVEEDIDSRTLLTLLRQKPRVYPFWQLFDMFVTAVILFLFNFSIHCVLLMIFVIKCNDPYIGPFMELCCSDVANPLILVFLQLFFLLIFLSILPRPWGRLYHRYVKRKQLEFLQRDFKLMQINWIVKNKGDVVVTNHDRRPDIVRKGQPDHPNIRHVSYHVIRRCKFYDRATGLSVKGHLPMVPSFWSIPVYKLFRYLEINLFGYSIDEKLEYRTKHTVNAELLNAMMDIYATDLDPVLRKTAYERVVAHSTLINRDRSAVGVNANTVIIALAISQFLDLSNHAFNVLSRNPVPRIRGILGPHNDLNLN
jgi:hypothetical protein